MAVSFNEVPKNIRVPFMYVEIDNSNAVKGASLMPFKTLVFGQKVSTGSAEALKPVRVTSKEQAKEFFGAGSMLAHMLEGLFENDSMTETIVVSLNDAAAGVAATGSVSFGGAVTAAGTLNLYIGGRRVRIGVASSEASSVTATAVAAAINADNDLPVTATVNGGENTKVDLIAKNKGEAGNSLDVRFNYYDGELLPKGLIATIVSMNGGSGNPDIADVINAIGDEHYNIIANPYTDASNLTALENELSSRWGAMRMIEGMAFSAADGSHAQLGTLGDSRNSPHSSIMNAAGSPTAPYVWASAVAGVVAYNGNIDPARPFQTLPVKGVLPPKPEDRFIMQENNLLLYDGISTHNVDAGGVVRIQRLITTYKSSPNGAEDVSYLDVNTPLTLAYIRYDFRNHILRKFPRHKLADDGTRYGAGQAIITPKVGKAEAIARFRLWEEMGLVEGADQFKKELICERNISDRNRLDWMLPADVINQFRIGGAKIGFIL
ncbi:MAG: phage tail protein [Desulfobacterales bacterium]|nr:phage tail protein [Desulfobacterales bacterium]